MDLKEKYLKPLSYFIVSHLSTFAGNAYVVRRIYYKQSNKPDKVSKPMCYVGALGYWGEVSEQSYQEMRIERVKLRTGKTTTVCRIRW